MEEVAAEDKRVGRRKDGVYPACRQEHRLTGLYFTLVARVHLNLKQLFIPTGIWCTLCPVNVWCSYHEYKQFFHDKWLMLCVLLNACNGAQWLHIKSVNQ